MKRLHNDISRCVGRLSFEADTDGVCRRKIEVDE